MVLSLLRGAWRKLSGAPPNQTVLEMARANALLIDVRSAQEFSYGHIEGALWLPLDRIRADIARAIPDRSQALILYCRSGARSRQARAIIAELGYDHAINGGGMAALRALLKRPLVRGPD